MYSINIDELSKGCDKVDLIAQHIKDNSLSLSFSYSSNFRNTRVIRRFIELISMQMGLSEEWVNRMILIVDELNNNAIEHGSRKGTTSQMRVTMETEEGVVNINIEAEDSGTGPHPKKALDMLQLRKDTEARGFKNHTSIRWRGLFLIITRLVDNLYFKDSTTWGLIVWIDKKISL